jgi:hypothetical protein
MDTIWTVKIERLETQLAVGIYDEELDAQPVWVSVTLTGLAPAVPAGITTALTMNRYATGLPSNGRVRRTHHSWRRE